MTNTAWAHLPNAKHIDKIIAHLKAFPEKWTAAWDAARVAAYDAARDAAWIAARDAAYDAAWDAAYDAARDAAWDAAYDAARDAAWVAAWGAAYDAARDAAWVAAYDAARDAAWVAARGAARGAARDAAWGAILALIAWDDCAYLLDQKTEHVELLALLGNNAAVLILPAVIAMENVTELEISASQQDALTTL